MRKFYAFVLTALFAGSLFYSCDSNELAVPDDVVSPEILDQLSAAGYDTENVFKTDFQDKTGYVVEYDMFMTAEQIGKLQPQISVPNTEHYRTTNLVTGLPRVIKVAIDPAFANSAQTAFDNMIAAFNAENIELFFQETSVTVTISGKGKKKTTTVDTDADIFISSFSERPRRGFITLGIAAGFPEGGDPANGFGLNSYWINNYNPSVAELTGVMIHEVGHTIGLRHTDYTTRESCGQNTNEGAAGVGAIYIPGTPTGADGTSIMQACGPSRVFNANDVTALNYLY